MPSFKAFNRMQIKESTSTTTTISIIHMLTSVHISRSDIYILAALILPPFIGAILQCALFGSYTVILNMAPSSYFLSLTIFVPVTASSLYIPPRLTEYISSLSIYTDMRCLLLSNSSADILSPPSGSFLDILMLDPSISLENGRLTSFAITLP